MLHVLIVGDSTAVNAMLQAALRTEGMVTELAVAGAASVAAKLRFCPDVVLIDLGLPDMDGLDLVERFAQDGDCGIIVMTANASEGLRIAGLDNGADDSVANPPSVGELAARIRAVHRRLCRPTPAARPLVTLDPAYRRLIGPGRLATPLTEAEFAALAALLQADGATVSRDRLGRVALRRSLAADDRSVDQLVLKLRRKLSLHGVIGRCILSSRGQGYVIPEPGRFVVTGEGTPRQDQPPP